MTEIEKLKKLIDMEAKLKHQIKAKKDAGERVRWQLTNRLAFIQQCKRKKEKRIT